MIPDIHEADFPARSPASGKLTVARALLDAVPGKLFDNHSAIDVARTVFDFAAPGFWNLVHSVRCTVLEAVVTRDVPLVVMTYCYADPDDVDAFRQFEGIVQRSAGQVLPVFLHCSKQETRRRIGNPDRAERRKITSVEGLEAFLDQFNLAPVPREDCLKLDTGSCPAGATARKIIAHFRLD